MKYQTKKDMETTKMSDVKDYSTRLAAYFDDYANDNRVVDYYWGQDHVYGVCSEDEDNKDNEYLR